MPSEEFKMIRRRLLPAFVLSLAVAPVAQAAITIDGSLDLDYGVHKAVQTNNTGFGNSTIGDGTSAGGSELNAAYAVVEGGFLNLMITGNLQRGGNYDHINIFIDDGRAGQGTINVANSGAQMHNMNGSRFSSDFQATYAIDVNGDSTTYVSTYDMTQTLAPANPIGSFPNNGAGSFTLAGHHFSFNNTNAAGVAGGAPSDAVEADALAVQTGLEIAIPLSALGSPTSGQIKILADINGGGNNFLSNQFLPGLPLPAQGNLGNNGDFDFSSGTGFYFLVDVPAVANVGTWASAGGGSWSNAGNWDALGIVPNAATDVAILGSAITGDAVITLDGDKTVGRLNFNSANKYTVAEGTHGTLKIDDGASGNPAINVQAGTHEISANVQLSEGLTISTVSNSALTISGDIVDVLALGINKTGGGLLVLSGNNVITSLTSRAGTTQLNSADAAGGGLITLGDPNVDNQAATLSLGASGLIISEPIITEQDLAANNNLRHIFSAVAGTNTLEGQILVNGGIVLGAAENGTLIVDSLIQNGATPDGGSTRRAIRVNGAGTVVLTNANISTGDTFVDSGTMLVTSTGALSGGSLNVFTGGTAKFDDLDALVTGVKIYTSGQVLFPGYTGAGTNTLNTSTISVDSNGTFIVGQSTTSASPVVVNATAVEFFGDFSGKIDLTNNQLITTNDQTTVRQQLLAGNIFTSSTTGTLGYKDTGGGTTQIQFAAQGDVDLDGIVDSDDFNAFVGGYGELANGFWTTGDLNYDGKVTTEDFNLLAGNFGGTTPVAAPALGSVVPEPASAALLALGTLGLLGRRRRD